jgi:probable rRNA maturation factor
MKTIIEANNLTKKRISSDFVEKIVQKTLKLSGEKAGTFELSVVFVGEAEMRKLNRKYKGKDKSTDVLSFQLDLGYNKKRTEKIQNYIGGEIILSPVVVARNAREGKVDFESELAFVLAHGVLHILGWKHGKKMYKLQDSVISNS